MRPTIGGDMQADTVLLNNSVYTVPKPLAVKQPKATSYKCECCGLCIEPKDYFNSVIHRQRIWCSVQCIGFCSREHTH